MFCFSKCALPGCESERQDIMLHRIPGNSDRFSVWMDVINKAYPTDIFRDLDRSDLKRLLICHKHFETKYITPKMRVTYNAYPTLFTTDEIESGKATRAYTEVDAGHVLSDHSYIKRKHEDHNYCNTQPSSGETFERPVGKTHSDDEDWRENPASEDNMSLPKPHTQPGVNGVPSSYNIKDKSTNDDAKHGIDPSSLDEFEAPPTESIFSWQKQEILYPTGDTDVLMCPEKDRIEELKQDLGDVSMYDDPPVESDTHAEYQCNVCENQIKGFRYTCVQCADWDLCGACEASAAHAAHYVLRVPSPRPYNEIQAVLAAIRQQLLSENLFLSEQITEDGLKSEPEEEGVGEEEAAEAEGDPLRAVSADGGGKRNLEDSDDEYSDGSEYRPPKRKRRRRSSDSSDTSQATTVPDTHYSDLCSPIPSHYGPDSETSQKQSDTSRRKPQTRTATKLHSDLTDTSHSNINQSGNQPDVLELPAAVYQVSNDLFRVPGTVFEVPGTIFEVPDAMGSTDIVLQVPDNATVFVQDTNTSHSLVDTRQMEFCTGEDGVSLGDSGQVLHLRVPPDTDDAALAQALQSQAYVVMQPHLEDPDVSTAFSQEPPGTCDSLDSIYTEENAVSLGDSGQVVHLRVPPETDDAALAQALQSQAYVAMQPNLEDPDVLTAFRQEPPGTCDSLDSIDTEEDAVSLGDSGEALHLRVPADTDDAALTQALTCQAYVVMQPLEIDQVIDNR